jgi:hypothetical protein
VKVGPLLDVTLRASGVVAREPPAARTTSLPRGRLVGSEVVVPVALTGRAPGWRAGTAWSSIRIQPPWSRAAGRSRSTHGSDAIRVSEAGRPLRGRARSPPLDPVLPVLPPLLPLEPDPDWPPAVGCLPPLLRPDSPCTAVPSEPFGRGRARRAGTDPLVVPPEPLLAELPSFGRAVPP